MKDERVLRKALTEHLESALAIADELSDSAVRYVVERALDLVRAGDIDRLKGDLR